ncbi:hypothetical protein NE237_015507 [Protea cynaroides]|uniref:Uncharacterized protein n=1 Tax=Protea cynaroides TaxID=273540 RepID=A0A9Q0KEF3_9MAGN|nr:hypothetical protein NE237_015507 [Protea cynaroides]
MLEAPQLKLYRLGVLEIIFTEVLNLYHHLPHLHVQGVKSNRGMKRTCIETTLEAPQLKLYRLGVLAIIFTEVLNLYHHLPHLRVQGVKSNRGMGRTCIETTASSRWDLCLHLSRFVMSLPSIYYCSSPSSCCSFGRGLASTSSFDKTTSCSCIFPIAIQLK